MGFPERLKHYRQKRDLSQRQLAAMLGVSPSIIALYERGERQPSFQALCTLGDFFGVKITDLVNEEQPTEKLGDDEIQLIRAWRRANRTYRSVALELLQTHQEEDTP